MRKTLRILCLLLPILYTSPASAGVDCGSPHTRIETVICGEPVLRALDSELTAAFKEAVERGVIQKHNVSARRNQIARQCWREADDALDACLLDAEVKALEAVAIKLGQSKATASSNVKSSWRYKAGHDVRALHLQKQLSLAESRLRSTGKPELTVATIFGLLNTRREQQHQLASGADLAIGIEQLEQRLASGCDHAVYGVKWRELLRKNNLSCSELRRPALFSSSDF